MKKLSIIIVNYNVCHLLEQLLNSVKIAIQGLDAEVIIVDNNSVDGSVEMIKSKFPQVILIENKINTGFSKANNQAIKIAEGKYVLLLNPDTVVEKDTFNKCCGFMDKHPEAGGLGVMMLDGKGDFLPESKRGIPTPWVAFYKIFGLARLFPKSRKFGRYHLGYLSKDETHEIEILSGAYMFLKKEALEKVGLLDEDYFMYGEDIDLSYRLIKGGYKNYYYSKTRIIHYKGESTKKTSLNYVFIFYRAMAIFARKHFTNQNAAIFSLLINLAIYLRAGLSLVKRFIKQIALPFTDGIVIYSGMYFLKEFWETHKGGENYYPPEFMNFIVPCYLVAWLLSIFFSGGYDKNFKPIHIIQGGLLGSFLISAVSNFWDAYRYSKALILMGGAWTIISVLAIRLIIHFVKYKNIAVGQEKQKRIAIVGNYEESSRAINLLNSTNYDLKVLGYISTGKPEKTNNLHLGSINKIKDLINIYNLDELIFCAKDISANQIIKWMMSIDKKMIEFKILPDDSNFIIGSSSKNGRGDFYTVNIGLNINQQNHVRNKRLVDVLMSFLFLILSPLLIWLVRNKIKFLENIFKVIAGNYSWVGFSDNAEETLPRIKKGVINPSSSWSEKELDSATMHLLNLRYAKDYSPFMDISLIFRSLRNLGA